MLKSVRYSGAVLALLSALGLSTQAFADMPKDEKALTEFIIKTMNENSSVILDNAQKASRLRQTETLRQQWLKDKEEKKELGINGRPVLGDDSAKVIIYEFANFNCDHCRAAKATINGILQEFKGQVKLVLKCIPGDAPSPSLSAARYFLAIAAQNRTEAWRFYDVVTDNQELLRQHGETYLKGIINGLKIDKSKFALDLYNDTKIQTILKEDREESEKYKVRGTPCFFVNNVVIRGSVPPEMFREALKTAMENTNATSANAPKDEKDKKEKDKKDKGKKKD